MSIYIDWVCNPYDITNLSLFNETFNLLSSFNILSSSQYYLDHTTTRFSYKISLPSNTKTSSLSSLLSNINKLRFTPIKLSLFTDSIDIIDYLPGLRSIIINVVSSISKSPIDYIEEVHYCINDSQITLFFPMYDGNYIYRSSDFHLYLSSLVNLNSLIGYQYLTSDPLLFLSLHRLHISLPEDTIYYLYGHILITIGSIENEYLSLIKSNIDSLKHDDYFVIPSSLSSLPLSDYYSSIYISLAKLFNYPYIILNNYFYVQNSHNTYWKISNLSNWFIESSRLIYSKNFPRVRIPFPISSNIPLKEWILKIHFLSLLSYTHLLTINPSLIPWLDKLYISDDMFISLYVSSLSDVEIFLSFFHSHFKDINQYFIISIPSLISGLIYRWGISYFPPYSDLHLHSIILHYDSSDFLILDTSNKSSIDLPYNLDSWTSSLISILQSTTKSDFSDIDFLLIHLKPSNVSNNLFTSCLRGFYTLYPFIGLTSCNFSQVIDPITYFIK